ncbi:MAG: LamG domain-containing protein, partial [SAR324 cluster bacterium]|nr:LamG domain-containing protein [SAR324 cluster bacterium]
MVTIDTINPQLDNITIGSSNSVPSLANQNDTITLTFDTTETIEKPGVKILGYELDNSDVEQGPHKNQWVATYRVNEGDDQDFLKDGLIAFYPLDGNTNDIHGTNAGITEGEITWSTDRYNRENKSFRFDGENDYLIVQDNDSLTSSTELTISIWFKKESGNSWMALVGKGSSDSNEEYTLLTKDNQVYFDVGGISGPYIQEEVMIPPNEWQHITATHTREESISILRVYLNGQDVGGITAGDTLVPNENNSYPLTIGSRFNPSSLLKGEIDSVRIYGKAMNSNEVASLYQYESQKIPSAHFHQFRLTDFEIEYQDPAGNIGEKKTWTSDDSFVDVDTSDPVVSLVSYASTNADNTTAMPGDN